MCVKFISVDLNLDSYPLHTPQTLILSGPVVNIAPRVHSSNFALVAHIARDNYFMVVLLLLLNNTSNTYSYSNS